jgi:hypothetical protein
MRYTVLSAALAALIFAACPLNSLGQQAPSHGKSMTVPGMAKSMPNFGQALTSVPGHAGDFGWYKNCTEQLHKERERSELLQKKVEILERELTKLGALK